MLVFIFSRGSTWSMIATSFNPCPTCPWARSGLFSARAARACATCFSTRAAANDSSCDSLALSVLTRSTVVLDEMRDDSTGFVA